MTDFNTPELIDQNLTGTPLMELIKTMTLKSIHNMLSRGDEPMKHPAEYGVLPVLCTQEIHWSEDAPEDIEPLDANECAWLAAGIFDPIDNKFVDARVYRVILFNSEIDGDADALLDMLNTLGCEEAEDV